MRSRGTSREKGPVAPDEITKHALKKLAKWKPKQHKENPDWVPLAVTNRDQFEDTVISFHTPAGVRSYLWLYGIQKPEFLARFAPLRERVWRTRGTP